MENIEETTREKQLEPLKTYPIKNRYLIKESESYVQSADLEWMEEQWGKNGSKLTTQECIHYLGEPPLESDLPMWLLEDEMKEEKEEKLRGFHSQVPHELCCDPEIPSSAVHLYCILHKFCKVKDLSQNPQTYVGRRKIAKVMGISMVRVSYWITFLQKKGWIEIVPRKGTSNIVTLNEMPFKEDLLTKGNQKQTH